MFPRGFASFLPLLVALCAASSAWAESERERFIRLHACPLVERLEKLATVKALWDRFIVVAAAGSGQRYVQCLFPDEEDYLYCEASSGRFGPAAGQPGHMELSPVAISFLATAGFDTEADEGNYPLIVGLDDRNGFGEVATILLGVLYDAYGAGPQTLIEFTAPLAPELAPGESQCTPLG